MENTFTVKDLQWKCSRRADKSLGLLSKTQGLNFKGSKLSIYCFRRTSDVIPVPCKERATDIIGKCMYFYADFSKKSLMSGQDDVYFSGCLCQVTIISIDILFSIVNPGSVGGPVLFWPR